MNCQKCRIEIEDGDLRREFLSHATRAHMSACAGCRVFGEERLALRRLVGGLDKVSAPADFDFRLRARMNAARTDAAPRASLFNFSPAALSWPLAGCLALVVSASLYFQQGRPDTPATPTPEHSRPLSPSPQTHVAEAARQSERTSGQETPPSVSVNRETQTGVSVNNPVNNPVNNVTRAGVEIASSNISRSPERRRALPARLEERAVVESASRQESAPRQIEDSTSTSLIGSTPRFAAGGGGGGARSEGALIPVQLNAPEGQLKVLLRDTSGEARTISVDSVSFGSRDVIGRRGATYTRASLSSNQGVW